MLEDLPRRRRVALAAAVGMIVLVVLVGPYLGSYYGLSNSRALSEIQATQRTTQQLLAIQQQQLHQQQQLLQIIQAATSPSVAQQNTAQLQRLIGCLYNRIDYDNGLIKHLNPNCTPAKITAPQTRATAPSRGAYILTSEAFRGDGQSATNTRSEVPAPAGVPDGNPGAGRLIPHPSQPPRIAAPVKTPPGGLVNTRHRAPSSRGKNGRIRPSALLARRGPSHRAPHR